MILYIKQYLINLIHIYIFIYINTHINICLFIYNFIVDNETNIKF